jgi:hypothetical protein
MGSSFVDSTAIGDFAVKGNCRANDTGLSRQYSKRAQNNPERM